MAEDPLWKVCIDLEAQAASVAEAREFVRRQLVATGMVMHVEDVVLVANELATNAVLHAQTPFRVTLQAFDHTLRLTVSDGSRSGPGPLVVQTLDIGGWGLVIVDQLCRDWGVDQEDGGKSVWVDFNPS